jgi:TolA-binding protein
MKKLFVLFLAVLSVILILPSLRAQGEQPAEYVKGMGLYGEGKYKAAGEEFKKFLNLYPASALAPEVSFRLAEVTEGFWEAAKQYRNLTLKYPDSSFASQARFRLGQYYYLQGDYVQARKEYQKLLELYPQSPYAASSQYWRGSILLTQENYGEARAAFEKVLQDYSRSNYLDWAQLGMGDSYLKEKNYSLALTKYQEVLDKYPKSDIINLVYFNLGQCYEKTGKEKEALESYRKLISECPDSLESMQAQKRINALEKKLKPVAGKYGVQVGAFSDQGRAMGLVKTLREKGYDAYIMTIMIEGRKFHRVRVGRLATEPEARELAETLRKKEKLPIRIFND